MHSRSGHLDQAGVHEQLDPGAFQRPRELAQVVVSGGIVAGHRDRVATHSADDLSHLAQVAEHGNPVDDWHRQFGGGQADTDHFHASVRLSLNPLAELLRSTEAADHNNVSEAASAAL